jgi:hypothetical protein
LALAGLAPAQTPGAANAYPARGTLVLPGAAAPAGNAVLGTPGVALIPATLPALPQAQTLPPAPASLAPPVAAAPEQQPPPVNPEIPVTQARFQAPPPYGPVGGAAPYPIQLEPPGLERLAQSLQTDAALQERIRQELRGRIPMERGEFPPSPVLSTEVYQGRAFEPRTLAVEPSYVIYRRLYFEQPNFERYGWDLGILAPPISAAAFMWDWVTLPYHLGTDPCRCFETDRGYCLPGDPVPLMLYPPELSLTGAALEVGTILTLVAIFP